MHTTEILYEISDINKLKIPENVTAEFRWLNWSEDLPAWNDHMSYRNNKPLTLAKAERTMVLPTARYAGLFVGEKMVTHGAIEPYSDTHWECADIGTTPEFRGCGYASQIVYMITKSILLQGRIATGNTLPHNIAMQKAFIKIGYSVAPYHTPLWQKS